MIKTDLTLPLDYGTEDIKNIICTSLPLTKDEIGEVRLVKRTLDLSDRRAPRYRATVAFSVDGEREAGLLKMRKKVFPYELLEFKPPRFSADFRPVVVGAGPAGLFAALTLAEAGARPIVIERGLPVEERGEKIRLFETLGILDTECNVQFGEGGAGTYSDGKLKVGAPDKYKMKVLDEFIAAGATEDIAYSTTAHLGTDRLPDLVKNIRGKIISLGGEFRFGAKLEELYISDGELSGIGYTLSGGRERIDTSAVILAVGHSARDTLYMFKERGLPMVAKGFGIGVRIEHPREYVNRMVYREGAPLIKETASYHLVTHLPNGRSVYSFCMCPGGSVVSASSEVEGIVTNGMSRFDRMADNSNAAFLVSVTPEDFGSSDALAGIEFQRGIERRAYSLTEEYRAPAQRLSDFMERRESSSFGDVSPSYKRGTEFCKCETYLPDFVSDSLRSAIPEFDEWMSGFYYGDAVITGPETRTTSPVRIKRTERYEAEGFSGIFPAGEGAGYAGGIVSSATDGIKSAEMLITLYGKSGK